MGQFPVAKCLRWPMALVRAARERRCKIGPVEQVKLDPKASGPLGPKVMSTYSE